VILFYRLPCRLALSRIDCWSGQHLSVGFSS